MPNAQVPAAAIGLPSPSAGAVMRQAHATVRAANSSLPYAARLRVALRQAWRDAKDVGRMSLRRLIEGVVEHLIATLDTMTGDPDLEDSHDQEDACEDEDAYDADLGAVEDEGAIGGLTLRASPDVRSAARHAAWQLGALLARRSIAAAVRP